jgi:hypothetical protein
MFFVFLGEKNGVFGQEKPVYICNAQYLKRGGESSVEGKMRKRFSPPKKDPF